jgi:TolB-like protein
VLPFQNLSGDPDQEYFADGMVEEIITALSRFRQLFVIARNSSFAYKGRSPDIREVGRDLGVRYVLEGSVRKAMNRVRITGQLIDTASGAHLWADRFDGDLKDVFDLQDQVTATVVGAIAPKLERAEIDRAKRKPTDSLDAYDYFLRGMASFHVYAYANREGNVELVRHFSRAIELDAEFATPYAMAAWCYFVRKTCRWTIEPSNETAEAVRLARRAVELGNEEAEVLAWSAPVLAHLTRDLDTGFALTDRAVALNGNLVHAWVWAGWMKIWSGDPDAALERFQRAARLNPLDPSIPRIQAGMAHALFFTGRYEQASSLAGMALRAFPNYHDGLRITAASHALAGRLVDAQNAVAQLRQIDPSLRILHLRDLQGPYRRPEDIARYEEAMRRAGLPE